MNDMPPEPEPSFPGALADALAGLIDTMRPVLETVEGYKVDLLDRGYSVAIAEKMACEFHRLIIANLIKGIS